MKIDDCKFTDQEFSGKTISELSDRPNETGMSATELKSRFDLIGKTMIALGKFSKLIEFLQGNTPGESASEQIGSAEISELNDPASPAQKAKTLWGQIKAIVLLLIGHTGDVSNPHGVTKTQVGLSEVDNTSDSNKPISTAQKAALDLKLDAVRADNLVDTVSFDSLTGTFTFHRYNDTSFTIDTVLEKVPISCRLDGTDFVLTLEDGTEQRVSLAQFVDIYTFQDTSTIRFIKAPDSNSYTAEITDGSITLKKLNPEVMTELQRLEQSARASGESAAAKATESATSATAAKTSETSAGNSASTAMTKATESAASAAAAKTSESSAGSSATDSKSYAVGGTGSREGEDTDNSKYYMEQAKAIVGGDYATRTEAQGYVTAHNADSTSHSGLFSQKVDKIQGKGLSTNDYTVDDQTKLAGIQIGATKNHIKNKTVVLASSAWDSSKKQVVHAPVEPEYNIIVGVDGNVKPEVWSAAESACIIVHDYTESQITFECKKKVPTIDIPMTIMVFV